MNTTSEKPFFKCSVPGCNFIGEGSITECPLCNAKQTLKEKLQKSQDKFSADYIASYIAFSIFYFFISYIIAGEKFNIYSWGFVFLSVTLSQFILQPIVKKIYLKIKQKIKD